VRYATAPEALRSGGAPPDLVVLPGSKDTLADLRWLHASGWAAALEAHVERGGRLAGICGGYQMLGERVEDPDGVEGGGAVAGLGCLPVSTRLDAAKITRQVRARLVADSPPFPAYEIHLGRTRARVAVASRALVEEGNGLREDGAVSADGRVWGTYLHGLFDAASVRAALLAEIGGAGRAGAAGPDYRALRESEYRRVAAIVAAHMDVAALIRLVEGTRS
jgi:adenosylcobyric acid synthase